MTRTFKTRATDGPLSFLLVLLAGVALLLTPTVASAKVTGHPHAARHTRSHRGVRHRVVRRHRAARPARKAPTAHTGAIHAVSAILPLTSAWTEPTLVNPKTIVLSDANRTLMLSQSQDYVLQCPRTTMALTYALSVWGGHNVVLQNCAITITTPDWAAHFKDQSGTLFIHDVHFGGTNLTGGIQLQEPGATVVMRDVLFDTVRGSYTTNHAECVQTWSGPARLLIDGLTCPTTYQGLFLLPNQWDSSTQETTWDVRNVDISATGAFALWLGNVQPSNRGAIPVWNLQNVFVSEPGGPRNWDGTADGDAAWRGVTAGTPAGGHFVRAVTGGATGPDDAVSPMPLAAER